MAWPVGILLACCLLLHEAGFASSIDSDIHYPEMVGGRCVFPFRYRGQVFHDCTQLNARHKWCSLNQSYTGYWKYCTAADFAKCVFPFWFRRMIYWECTDDGNDFGKKWCSLTRDFNRDQIWKFC